MKYSILLALILALALPLHAGNKKAAGQAKSKPNPEKIFNRKDKDHDGFLTKEEFLAGAKNPAKAGNRFIKLDTNSDGKLSLAEFKAGKTGKAKKGKGKKGKQKDAHSPTQNA